MISLFCTSRSMTTQISPNCTTNQRYPVRSANGRRNIPITRPTTALTAAVPTIIEIGTTDELSSATAT